VSAQLQLAQDRIDSDPRLRERIVHDAWAKGELGWKLFPYQDGLYNAIHRMLADPACNTGTVNVSRQFGKTHTELLVSNEVCLREPDTQVRFAAPTGLELRKRTLPIMREILGDCPAHLRPKWNSQDKVWNFRNGSQIHMAGVNDGHADDLRGARCHLGFPDESGFIDEFRYLIDSVLLPMTTRTRGTIIASSTPPPTTAHDFVPFARQCQLEGNYYHATIHDSDLAPEEIAALCRSYGGPDAIAWRREYLAEFVVDTELQVIPEWDPCFIADAPWSDKRPFWHNYSALDFGLTRRDFHGGVFSHYDRDRGILWVEDEFCDSKLPRLTPDRLVHALREKEVGLWSFGGRDPLVHMRRADNNAVDLLVQMAACGMVYMPVQKWTLPAMVAKTRRWFKEGRIRISPRCKLLILSLETGIWKDERHINVEFDRNATTGHLDLLAALIYQVLDIDEQTDPVPANWGLGPDQIRIRRESDEQRTLDQWYGGGQRWDA
jgi:hypothetical protein